MTKPLVVSIPHRLGKEEALRRMKAGLGSARTQYAQFIQVNEEVWSGDRLAFSVTAMKQQVSGIIDVFEDQVRLEVTLPWLLNRLAHGIQSVIQKKGTLLLEKK
ncbi:MAG TPA: polyhydroxyalkanoic acid system family protein [Nitrobacter sp.]|nr:polyhydroxyalkanoic acid system family protein [Nitrobacter sp.]